MKEKIDQIKEFFEDNLPDYNIEYLHSDANHKFRFNHSGPTHWLRLSDEVVEDQSYETIINRFGEFNFLNTLLEAKESKIFGLTNTGLFCIND